MVVAAMAACFFKRCTCSFQENIDTQRFMVVFRKVLWQIFLLRDPPTDQIDVLIWELVLNQMMPQAPMNWYNTHMYISKHIYIYTALGRGLKRMTM